MKTIVPAGSAPGSAGTIGSKEIVAAKGGVEALVNRDQWDRPLILRPEGHLDPCRPRTGKGGGCFCMTGYTRVTTMAETLSDSYGLARWQKGNVVKGLVLRPSLLNTARIVKNPGELYEIVDIAEELGDEKQAAANGTFMHRLTEMVDHGYDLPDGLPDNILAMVDAYVAEMARHHFTAHETEEFVVQDTIQVAGTFDKRIDHFIGDVKTGQNLDLMALKTTMQVAMYAAGTSYDLGTAERGALDVDRDRGVLIWIPWVEDPKDAECEARWLDLTLGRKAVLEALKVRNLRKLKATQILPRIK